MSVKSLSSAYIVGSLDGSTFSSSSVDRFNEIDVSDVIQTGQLRKLKRMKKKFFVLRGDSSIQSPARLEYYDNEKKWKHGLPPKRSIILKTCVSINRKSDSKHKLAIALYTSDDCFAVACETEEELEFWLESMLLLQHGKTETGEPPRPTFDHLWQVNVKKKGLGGQQNILGPCRLCLTSASLTLVKMPHSDPPETKEFPLMSIRRCGHSDGFFYMELGRSSCTGAGELWMQTEDNVMAQNMHEAILNAMRACVKEDLPPRPRTRSSSATESTKPISVGGRRQTTPGMTPLVRDRADSLSSRPRTVSEGPNVTINYSGSHPNHPEIVLHMGHRDKNCHLLTPDHHRPTSVHRAISSSPPPPSILASPGSIACSTDSAGSSLSIDEHDLAAVLNIHHHLHGGRLSYSHTPENSLPSEPAIVEETDDYMSMAGGNDNSDTQAEKTPDNYLSMTPKLALATSPAALAGTGNSTLLNRSLSVGGGGGTKQASTKPRLTLAHAGNHNHGGGTNLAQTAAQSSAQSAYMDMSSPHATSWSPVNIADGYMPMAPGEKSGHHTRSSSIGEDVPDGYVPMAPQYSEEQSSYVDMKPRRSLPRDVHVRGRLSPASSSSLASSITSGTPSLSMGTPPPPLRLADFHLDKVASLLTPSEDDDLPPLGVRPFRTYSVGSRPEQRQKMRLETIPSPGEDSTRVRAFSLGSKRATSVVPRPEIKLGLLPNNSTQPHKKSLSAPLLNSSPFPTSWHSAGILKNVLFGSMASSRSRPGGSDLMVLEYNGSHGENEKPKSPHRYVSSDSLGSSIADREAVEQEHDDKTGTSYGSSDSLGKVSSASLTPSSRPRSNSKTSLLHRAAGKLETIRRTDKKHKHEVDRLESVPQGRDTDYVEYNCRSPTGDDYVPMHAQNTPRSLSRSSSRVSKRSSRTTSKEDLNRTSESNSQPDDEYVELARPPPLRKTYLKEKKKRSQTTPVQAFNPENEYLPMEPSGGHSTQIDSAYLDMNFTGTKKDPQSESHSYVPMSYTESQTNPEKEASVRPNSLQKLGFRQSREIRNEDYMEMSFGPNSDMEKLKQKMRLSTPTSSDADSAPKPASGSHSKGSSSATSFLSSLLGRKHSSGAPPKIATPVDDKTGNTLPRSTRSMPPSPFSSLKRSKSTKPRLPSAEDSFTHSETSPPCLVSHTGSLKRNSDSKSLHFFSKPSSQLIRAGSSPRNSAHCPLTPPGPDCPVFPPQMSPPTSGPLRPNSSQPISIVATGTALALRRGVTNESNESGLAQLELFVPRMSASPRQHPAPPLSPLPEVQFPISPCGFEPNPPSSSSSTSVTATSTNSSVTPSQPPSKLVTSPSATESAYLSMDFSASRSQPNILPVPLPLTPNRSMLPSIRDDLSLPSPSDSEKSASGSTPSVTSSVSEATTPTAVSQSYTSTPTGGDKENRDIRENGSFSSKLRAASLEKIVVGALDKVRTGIGSHKRHNSGDKPRKTNIPIYRSNSYQPVGSRGIGGNIFTPVPSKSASVFPTLGDIPAGKLLTYVGSETMTSSQVSPNHVKATGKQLIANRLSSSSLASLGEEMAITAELQAVTWTPDAKANVNFALLGLLCTQQQQPCSSPSLSSYNPNAQASHSANLSPAPQANSSSPSPSSSTSRPPSVLSERELHYATLDLAPATSKEDEVPRSPRSLSMNRPGSSFAFAEPGVGSGLSYAKIDFTKSEGLRNTTSGVARETRNS